MFNATLKSANHELTQLQLIPYALLVKEVVEEGRFIIGEDLQKLLNFNLHVRLFSIRFLIGFIPVYKLSTYLCTPALSKRT